MGFWSRKIEALRQKPYKTRKRILWATLAIATVIVFLILILTLQYKLATPHERDVFAPLEDSFQDLKNELRK